MGVTYFQIPPPPTLASDNDYSNLSSTIVFIRKDSPYKPVPSLLWTNKVKHIAFFRGDKRVDFTFLHLNPIGSKKVRTAYFSQLLEILEEMKKTEGA